MTSLHTRSQRRRTFVGLFIVICVFVVFGGRLFDVQVVNAAANVQQSIQLGFGVQQTLYGSRGIIVGEDGTVLATNTERYDVQIDPSATAQTITRKGSDGSTISLTWPDVAGLIAPIIGEKAADIEKAVADALAANPASQYALLATEVTTEQYRKLADLNLPYLAFPSHPVRTYPDGAVAGNLIGFVGQGETPLAGLELSQQQCLQQKNGQVTYQKSRSGEAIPGTQKTEPAVNGGTLTLTINSDLQWYMQQLIAQQVQDLGAVSGTITVVDVKTGKMRAAAEYPTVDPNNINATPQNYWRSHIFTDTFEPGSTFKALTASMLIDSGTATPTTTAQVPWRITFPNGANVIDAEQHSLKDYTLAGVLMESSNVGASILGTRMSPDARYDYLKRFGIGDGSAVNFYGEAHGNLPPVSAWDRQKVYDITYGQGLTTTVPELLSAYQAIANNGKQVPLSLVDSCTAADGTVTTPAEPAPKQIISPSTAQDVTHILENVATQGPLASKVSLPGYVLAFKTGTAQKYDPATGGYLPGAYFTTLTGFAPANDPQYLVAVTLNQPQKIKDSSANAAAFQQAMAQVLKTYHVVPDNAKPVYIPMVG